jgi:hypothetical protein
LALHEKLIELPKDSVIDLRLFKEKDNFFWDKPYFVNDHHIFYPIMETEMMSPSKWLVMFPKALNP